MIQERGCGVWIFCLGASFLFLCAGIPIRTVQAIHDAADNLEQAWQEQIEVMGILGYQPRQDDDESDEEHEKEEHGHRGHCGRSQSRRHQSPLQRRSCAPSPTTDVTFIQPHDDIKAKEHVQR